MKKFERLPHEARQKEIAVAALSLFREKGFSATTMENIVEKVSLSKGGVYRIYPSTTAILSDLMIGGMRLRNAYYEKKVKETVEAGGSLTIPFFIEMIGESLLLSPDISAVYAEFLIEKRRNPSLEELYRHIVWMSVRETETLIRRYGAEEMLRESGITLEALTDVMNVAILSLHVLRGEENFPKDGKALAAVIGKIFNVSI